MRVYIPNFSEQSIGGGWTFIRNIKSGLAEKVQWAHNWREADVILIASVAMTDANEMEEAHAAGVPIVFRVDNIPRKSRNKRGRIYDKMRRFGEIADHVIFQSKWAQEYAGFLTGIENSSVIYNGVDQKIFYQKEDDNSETFKYLYVQFNRDENKRFPEAFYHFHKIWREWPNRTLTIVGAFSDEMINAGFDFFGEEPVEYIPPITNPNDMAEIYRDHDFLLFPAFMDAAPNTVLEARACGLDVLLVNQTGGTIEMLEPELDISLERMAREYYNIFDLILNEKVVTV